jgi:hypothetical protein
LSNSMESDCTSCMLTSRATGSRSGALERTRFAPSLGRKHSTTVTLRRIARRGPYCLIPLHIGISSGCSRTGIRLAVLEGIQEAFFRRSRSTAGAAAFRDSAHLKCMHALSPSRFESLSSCGRIPECPNDALQLLMSCAQATARRDAEGGRVRSAKTRTARA